MVAYSLTTTPPVVSISIHGATSAPGAAILRVVVPAPPALSITAFAMPYCTGVVEPTDSAVMVVDAFVDVALSVVAPVTAKVLEIVKAPVSATVPSTAFVIVSPFNRVIDVVDAMPPS